MNDSRDQADASIGSVLRLQGRIIGFNKTSSCVDHALSSCISQETDRLPGTEKGLNGRQREIRKTNSIAFRRVVPSELLRSGQFEKPFGHLRPLAGIFVLEKYESVFPILPLHALHPRL